MERNPQKLADVQKGDLVWVFSGREPFQAKVERLYKNNMKVDGDSYWISDGVKKNLSQWVTVFIAVGEEADKAREKFRVDRLRRRAALDFLAPAQFTREGVIATRVRCDAAEAALRELGEWKDEA